MYLPKFSGGYKCSECGRRCGIWMVDVKEYVYKVKDGRKWKMQCSYTCWQRAKKRGCENGERKNNERCL